MNIAIKEITYDGIPINIDYSDYAEKILIDKAKQDFEIDDPNKLIITYQTLYDQQLHNENAKINSIDLSFYVAGHIYGSPKKGNTTEQDEVHPPFSNAILDIANNKSIKFGVLTGDTVYKPSENSYNNLNAAMSKTEKPFFIAPGNHDLDGSMLFQELFKNEYQAFIENDNLFVLLTPRQDWSLDKEQVEFLEGAVVKNKWDVSNIFIFTHQLFWLEKNDERFPGVSPNSWANKENESNFWSQIKPMFSNYEGEVYFIAGDVGAFANENSVVYERDGNLHFIASGMGGGIKDNYLIVNNYKDSSVKFDLVALNGNDPNALGLLTDW